MDKNNYLEIEKQVKRIRKFYNHLQIFVIMMLVLILFSDAIMNFFSERISNSNALYWIELNIWINAGIWLFVILIQGLIAYKYKFGFVKNWEQNKIEAYINKKDKTDAQ